MAANPGSDGANLAAGDLVWLTGRLDIVDGITWYEVHSGVGDGWLRASAVELVGHGFDSRPCGDVPAALPETALAYRPGTVDGSADGIAAIERHGSESCSRVVLYLSDDLSGADAVLATAFPDGLTVVDLTGRIRLEMPGGVDVIPELEIATASVGTGEVLALRALRPDGTPAFNIDAGPARIHVSFLARPARVLIDLVRESDVTPAIGGGVVINAHSIADARDAGDGRTVAVTGFAKLLDGLGEIAFRIAPSDGAEPGTGTAIDVQFAGTERVDPVFRSWYFYETPLFDGEWAEFRFTIAGMKPGNYEIFLGLGSSAPAEIAEPGVFQILDVGKSS